MLAADVKVTRTLNILCPALCRGLPVQEFRFGTKSFSDQNLGEALGVQQQAAEAPVPCRMGYYDMPRTWEERGHLPGEANQITQRFADQKAHATEDVPTGRPSFLEACSEAVSLRRSGAKKKRQLALLRQPPPDSSSSSSSPSESDTIVAASS